MNDLYLETLLVVVGLIVMALICILIKEVIELYIMIEDRKRRRHGNKDRKVQGTPRSNE